MLRTPIVAFSALGFTVGAFAMSAAAGDCVPEWDATFGVPGISSAQVFDFVTHDGALFASGAFTSIDGVAANRIAKWDGSAWSPLGSGASNQQVYTVASFGGDVYAAGYFDSMGGVSDTAKIARWDGSNWSSIGAQMALFSNQLWDLTTWDDGNGEALYVAGNFQNAGGVAGANYIAKFDGTSFSPLGGPIGGAVPLIVFTAYSWDDGTGDALYIGGRFLTVDGVAASRIARWDGTSWSALGSGLTGPGASPAAYAMAAFDDGSGEALYVAGQTFNTAGGVTANRVARWDGSTWSAVGDGFANGIVWDLEVVQDADGPRLYAFGTFTASGATPVAKVARWNGVSWEAADGGADDDCYAGLVHDDGSGPSLYVGGRYTTIGTVTASGIARRSACPAGLTGDVDGDGMVNVIDLLAVLAAWGPCPGCPEDVNGDGEVNVLDVLVVLANWS